jgi:arsenate reductase (thioredoxin)
MKSTVLILCTGNSCRSQMAEGFLRRHGGDKFEVHSAGTYPTTLNPLAVKVMSEAGVDISSHESKSASRYLEEQFAYIITVCDHAKESCPVFPGASIRLHWPFDDPADATGTEEERLPVFRRVRDEIDERIREFVVQAK